MRQRLDAAVSSQVDGIVFDLGVSSFQLDQRERGFSFQADGPLDMRMDRERHHRRRSRRRMDEGELARLLFAYGDEPQAKARGQGDRARRGKRPRSPPPVCWPPLSARAKGGRQGPRDPATRTFQALRIAVNDELGEFERGLAAAEDLLRPGGRLVVVAFHSGEDALVKSFVNRHGGRQAQPSRHLPPVVLAPPRWRWVRHGVIKPAAQRLPPIPAPAPPAARGRAACRATRSRPPTGRVANGGAPREPRLSGLLGPAGGGRRSRDLPAEVRGPRPRARSGRGQGADRAGAMGAPGRARRSRLPDPARPSSCCRRASSTWSRRAVAGW